MACLSSNTVLSVVIEIWSFSSLGPIFRKLVRYTGQASNKMSTFNINLDFWGLFVGHVGGKGRRGVICIR